VASLVRTKKTLITIGDVRERHPMFLSVKSARERATVAYSQKRYGKTKTTVCADVVGWTWAVLNREYQALIAKPRETTVGQQPQEATLEGHQR
jgi:hypothetical protein